MQVIGSFCSLLFFALGQGGKCSRCATVRRLVEFLRSSTCSIPARGEVCLAVAHAVRGERIGTHTVLSVLNVLAFDRLRMRSGALDLFGARVCT
jgi:hypothetical protein